MLFIVFIPNPNGFSQNKQMITAVTTPALYDVRYSLSLCPSHSDHSDDPVSPRSAGSPTPAPVAAVQTAAPPAQTPGTPATTDAATVVVREEATPLRRRESKPMQPESKVDQHQPHPQGPSNELNRVRAAITQRKFVKPTKRSVCRYELLLAR